MVTCSSLSYCMDDSSVFANADVTGCFEVQHIAGKSTATRVFSKYPLKLIVPSKVAPSSDVVWIYALSYGGGFVSGDSIYIKVKVGSQCTSAITTQASTKIYKSIAGLTCKQMLTVSIDRGGTLVMLPDPVTCFLNAKYDQFQVFHLDKDASLVLVDWCTSGRREREEIWCFDYYRSTNHVFLEGKPLFLDSVCLKNEEKCTILSRMQHFHVIAMVMLYGPRVQSLCVQLKETISVLNSQNLNMSSRAREKKCRTNAGALVNSSLLVTCSTIGPREDGLVVRVAANATEIVYDFLKHQLASLHSLVGVAPYAGK